MNTSDNSTHSWVLEPEDNKLDGKPDDEAEKLADSEHAEGDQDPTEEEKKDEEKKKKRRRNNQSHCQNSINEVLADQCQVLHLKPVTKSAAITYLC